MKSKSLLQNSIFAIISLARLLSIFNPSRASAYTYGGSFMHTPGVTTNLTWSYLDYIDNNYLYTDNIEEGVGNWNSAASRVSISEASFFSDIMFHSSLMDSAIYGNLRAYTRWTYPTYSTSEPVEYPYSFTEIFLNETNMNGDSDFYRTKVITHEIGHALGLAHPPNPDPDHYDTIMRQGSLSFNTPQAYDNYQIDLLYN